MLLNVSLETRNQISIPIMIHLEPPSLDVLPPTIIEELQISKNLIQSFSIVAFHGFVHEIMILISLYYEIYSGRIFLQLLIKIQWPEYENPWSHQIIFKVKQFKKGTIKE